MPRFAVVVLGLLLLAQPASAQPTTEDEPRAQAQSQFLEGKRLFREQRWDAALAAFAASRELYATRGNTQNAALCLVKLDRFGEALEMFRALVRDFPDLPDAAQVNDEIRRLEGLTGALSIQTDLSGASVFVDGRLRAKTPVTQPVMVNTGTHVVRVIKPDRTPYERQVDVSAGQRMVLEPALLPLVRPARLRIRERDGRTARVMVDGVAVGNTPWEGNVEPGPHAVTLRGDGVWGTQPATVVVKRARPTTFTVALEELACRLQIETQPVNATLALDRVDLGRGVWAGLVRCGEHLIEAGADGFLTVRRTVSVTDATVLDLVLDRDPDSPLGVQQSPARIFVDVAVGPAIAPSYFGAAHDGCDAACSAAPPVGFTAIARGGYQFGSGIGLGVDVGALWLRGSVDERAVSARAVPTPSVLPTATSDTLTLWGILAGLSASLQRGEAWPWTVRLTAGAMLGAIDDERTADVVFPNGAGGFGPVSERVQAHYFFVVPEVGIAHRLGAFELGVFARPMILAALVRPQLGFESVTSDLATGGFFSYDVEALTGSVIFVGSLALSARWGFY